MRNLLLIVLLGLFVFLLGACAEKEVAEETVAVESSEETGERVEGGFSYVKEEGKAVLKVKGDSASGLDGEKVTIENPRVERFFYEGDKEKSVDVEARTGTWDRKSNQVQMEEDVKGVVRLEEEIVIEHADKMVYEPSAHLLILRGKVRIRQVRSILNADEVIIYLDEEDREITKVTAEGKVTGRIFPEELKKNR